MLKKSLGTAQNLFSPLGTRRNYDWSVSRLGRELGTFTELHLVHIRENMRTIILQHRPAAMTDGSGTIHNVRSPNT